MGNSFVIKGNICQTISAKELDIHENVFAVCVEGQHIGEVFAYLSEKEADIGWLIDKRYWGNGYATEAAKLLVEYIKNNPNDTTSMEYKEYSKIIKMFPKIYVLEK